jgi:hypothetical protein
VISLSLCIHHLRFFELKYNKMTAPEQRDDLARPSAHDRTRNAAQRYIYERHVPELLSHLLALVAYARPEDPRDFLLNEVRRLRQQKPTALFGDAELTTMFDMIDQTRSKFITVAQLKNAYANLALERHSSSAAAAQAAGVPVPKGTPPATLSDDAIPPEVRASGKVDVDTFKAVIGARLQTQNLWASA